MIARTLRTVFGPACWLPLVLAVGLATLAAGESNAQSTGAKSVVVGAVGQRIADFVKSAEASGFAGAVLAARDGKVLAAVAAGHADLHGKTPNSPATLFELASATKPFTAIAILQLSEAKRLSLDDSISRHLPGVPADCEAITVRHLLQHTSGIPATNYQGGGDDLAKVLPQFLAGGPQHTPGSRFEYWNQGYALLSEIIERVSGTSYEAYLREHIFQPAGMKSSCFNGERAPSKSVVAIGRSTKGNPRSALAHPYGSYGLQYRGMGGLVANLVDLWRWDRALKSDKLLSPAAKGQLFTPGLNDYALGWYVRQESGRLVQSHTGSVRGFLCDLRRYPEQDGCVFVLCNDDEAPCGSVAKGVEQLLFGEPLTVVMGPAQSLDSKLADALAGKYVDGQGREFIVERDGEAVRALVNWAPPNGPVTRSTLQVNGDGAVVLPYGDEVYPVGVQRQGDGQVEAVTFMNSEYRRAN